MERLLSSLIRQFLEDCEVEQGHSPRTIRNYDHYLGRFLAFTDDRGAKEAGQLTLDLVRQWRLKLNREGLKSNTLNYHLIALRSFLKYLAKRDIPSLPAEKIDLADQPARQIEFLEIDELDRLLAAPNTASSLGLRDRAILETLFSTGLRVSELVALNRDQVNLDRGEFGLRGKGGKVRVVFLSPIAKDWLDRYLESRSDPDPALFIRIYRTPKLRHLASVNRQVSSHMSSQTEKNGHLNSDTWQVSGGEVSRRLISQAVSLRLTARQIERIVKKHAAAAGIVKNVHPHVLRHSLATDLLQNGADLRSVQEILGHSSVTTTQIYTHVTNPRLKEVHQAFHRRGTHHPAS